MNSKIPKLEIRAIRKGGQNILNLENFAVKKGIVQEPNISLSFS